MSIPTNSITDSPPGPQLSPLHSPDSFDEVGHLNLMPYEDLMTKHFPPSESFDDAAHPDSIPVVMENMPRKRKDLSGASDHGKKPEKKSRQYGGGIKEFKKGHSFPSEKEKEFFFKYVELSHDIQLKRLNSACVDLPVMRMKFINLDEIEEDQLHVHVSTLIDIFIRMTIQKAKGNLVDTKYWFQLHHHGYKETNGFFIIHKTYKAVDGGVIMNQISAHMQSNKELSLDENFTVAMNIFKEKDRSPARFRGRLRGRGFHKNERIRNTILEMNFGIKQNRVIGASHCVIKAIVLGKMETDIKSLDMNDSERISRRKEFKKLMSNQVSLQHRGQVQLQMAREFLESLGMDPDQESHDLDDIKEIASRMPDYKFIVWSIKGHQIIASEEAQFNPDGTKFIGLYFRNKHYEFVSHTVKPRHCSFCYKCFQFVDQNNHHKVCDAKCRRCGFPHCDGELEHVYCSACNITFKSRSCFEKHLKPRSKRSLPFCAKYFYCPHCLTVDRRTSFRGIAHECGTRGFCTTCRRRACPDHVCKYPLPTEGERERSALKEEEWRIIVYDMECVVAESGELDENAVRGPRHEPNMICVEMFCHKCIDTRICEDCPPPWHYSYDTNSPQEEPKPKEIPVLYNIDSGDSEDENYDADQILEVEERSTPLARFCKFLRTSSIAREAIVVAHNGQGYDHPITLGELDRQEGVKGKEPRVILKGMKITSAEHIAKKHSLYFKDSLLFIPMPLSKMPAAFGLEGEEKGKFPYLFNHPDHYNTVLATLPPKGYYGLKHVPPAVREEFEEWYEAHYHDGFVLHDELLKYCRSDVRILTLTLISYIKMCRELFHGWNPLVQGTTIASFAMFVMRNQYIREGDLGYIPENGYGSDTNSMIALKYLMFLEKQNPSLHLQHKLRGGEYQIKINGRKYKVDGFNKATNEIFEVYGCLWHGCEKCNPIRDRPNKMCDMTPQELFDQTKRRGEDLVNAGYTLHTIWECEIHEQLEKDKEMRSFFELNKHYRRLMPREGVFGGRTQPFRAITEATEDVEMAYLDFNSQYPYLNAGGTAYPRGDPTVLTDDFPDTDKPLHLRGIVFCDVLPGPQCEIGYLPDRIRSKLMFTLCRSCAIDENTSGQCTHLKVSERYLTGVWTTDELNKAISKGYKVLKYHEIWYWDEWDWVKGGFLADYIKPLLTVKYQSSGWPKEDMTDEEKEEYIQTIFEKDGVRLDPDKMVKNVALRSLTKIYLNSAWGKFAENPIRTESRLILKYDGASMANFFNDPMYEPTGMVNFGEHKVWISRKPKKSAAHGARHANLVIGIITPSAGRLQLLDAIEKAGIMNTVYCDTDSLMFLHKKGEDPLKELKGDHLGMMASEIPEGWKLQKTVCCGPKNYGYQMVNDLGETKHVIKSKGITMHSENCKRITFEKLENQMKEFVEEGVVDPLEGEMLRFKRGAHAFDGLWTCVMKKNVNPRMDKGRFVNGLVTPFGQLPLGTKLIDDYPFY